MGCDRAASVVAALLFNPAEQRQPRPVACCYSQPGSDVECVMNNLRQVLSALVMTRSRHPRFEGILPRIDCAGSARNPYCGDAVSITITLDATGSRLAAVRCCVEGCALCKASADLMAECLQGKTRQEASQFDSDFQQLLRVGHSAWAADHPLNALRAFAALQAVPARSSCAVLPWQALRQALSTAGSVQL